MKGQLATLPPEFEQGMLTERLELVPMRRTHAAVLFPILSDPKLYGFTGGSPPPSAEALAETYARLESRRSPDGTQLWLNWLLRRRESEEAVGYAQTTVHPTHAYVAWVVGTQWQGHGYASEAAVALVGWLAGLGVPEIRACVHPAHEASRRVAHNAGLRLTEEVLDGEEVWAVSPGEI